MKDLVTETNYVDSWYKRIRLKNVFIINMDENRVACTK